ncbi:MAG TPA: hypothetical protein VFY96_12060 [Candidatus Binatia bacterium]|nr:hypothetical protein [Candidatus Binatia bacterium]
MRRCWREKIDAAIVGPGHVINATSSGVDLRATLPQTMLVTTRRLAAAKPHVIEAYLKTFVEAIAVTLDPANKELVMRLQMTNLRLASSAAAEEAYHSVINSYEREPHTSVEGMKRLQKLRRRSPRRSPMFGSNPQSILLS